MKYYSNEIHFFNEFKMSSLNTKTNIGISWYQTSKITIIVTSKCYADTQCIYINLVPIHLKIGPTST
jgi:hypothetical protein